MFVKRLDPSTFETFHNTACQRILPWEGVAQPPFDAMWCVVKPGETSRIHNHHEGEVFVIVDGTGVISAGTESAAVEAGDVVFFPAFVDHALENRSTERDLSFVTVWWEDLTLARDRVRSAVCERRVKTTLITATPPTPNGDLHLGHLSGPYVAADVFARYLRMRGERALFVSGSDEHQSYVSLKAEQDGRTPGEVADQFGRAIQNTLRQSDIVTDYFLEPRKTAGYRQFVQTFFSRLYRQGRIVPREKPALYSEARRDYVAEAFVQGLCPHCGAGCDGNACEACGRPNDCVDLQRPTCKTSGSALVRHPLTKLYFPLQEYQAQLRSYYGRVKMPSHLRALCEQMLSDGLPEIAVSHRTDWGIPVPVEGFESQRIYVWFEMAAGYLFMSRALDTSGKLWQGDAGDLVQFFGFDNGYFHAVLFPAIFMAYGEGIDPPNALVTNEFYQLDGSKFSTSRGHAVWARDLLKTYSADAARFYLSHTRPETSQTNFNLADFAATIDRELIGSWNGWLADVTKRLSETCGGVTPEPGAWTCDHQRFYGELCSATELAAAAYAADTFSMQKATRILCELVRVARRFGEARSHLNPIASKRDEMRTTIALELAAVKTLALLAAPILPEFSSRLWRALGFDSAVSDGTWEDVPAFLPAGQKVVALPPVRVRLRD